MNIKLGTRTKKLAKEEGEDEDVKLEREAHRRSLEEDGYGKWSV